MSHPPGNCSTGKQDRKGDQPHQIEGEAGIDGYDRAGHQAQDGAIGLLWTGAHQETYQSGAKDQAHCDSQTSGQEYGKVKRGDRSDY